MAQEMGGDHSINKADLILQLSKSSIYSTKPLSDKKCMEI
uniref:Uncharacterized protein n=1 Tax=Klebsiella pneumoniae TaxID=573 RepID=A0A7D5GGJ2_KLEPN|nr:hypothetical protein [Klebsiella pneumoniae]